MHGGLGWFIKFPCFSVYQFKWKMNHHINDSDGYYSDLLSNTTVCSKYYNITHTSRPLLNEFLLWTVVSTMWPTISIFILLRHQKTMVSISETIKPYWLPGKFCNALLHVLCFCVQMLTFCNMQYNVGCGDDFADITTIVRLIEKVIAS